MRLGIYKWMLNVSGQNVSLVGLLMIHRHLKHDKEPQIHTAFFLQEVTSHKPLVYFNNVASDILYGYDVPF